MIDPDEANGAYTAAHAIGCIGSPLENGGGDDVGPRGNVPNPHFAL
jgi:hypothetical protein